MKYFFLLILVAAVSVSYFKSEELFGFYVRTWNEQIKKISREDSIENIERRTASVVLKREADDEELEELVYDIKRLKAAYPYAPEFHRAIGYAYMLSGRELEGAVILAALPFEQRVADPFFSDMIRVLFENGYYSDLISYMDKHGPSSDPNINYRHGGAFVELARGGRLAGVTMLIKENGSEDAARDRELKRLYLQSGISRLESAYRGGRRDHRTLGMLGIAYCEMGDFSKGITALESAREMNIRDPEINLALARAYREVGRYEDAKALFRAVRK